MSLRNRLLFSFLTIVAAATLVAGIGLSIISSFNTVFNDIMRDDVPVLLAMSEIKAVGLGLIESARAAGDLEIEELTDELAEFSEGEEQLRDLMDDLQVSDQLTTEQVENLRGTVLDLNFVAGQYLGLLQSRNTDSERLDMARADIEEAETNFLDQANALLTQLNDHLPPEIQAVNSATQSLFVFGAIAGILLIIGAIILGIYLANTIIRPLGQLTFAVDQLREGNREVHMTIESQDEIGTLAQSFNQMSNELFQTTVSRDYVENILQAMGSVLIVADEKGQIETSNPFSQQLLGYSEAELQGRNVRSLFENLEDLKLDATTSRTSIITKSGESIPVTLSRRKVEDSQLVVYNAQDLTEVERMQQQLLEAQNQIEAQFKRGNRIYTMMDLMRRQLNNVFEHGASREELREYMDMLNTEFEKLSDVIKERNN